MALNVGHTVQQYHWPQLLPLAPPKALHDGARALSEQLAGEWPWEGIIELRGQAQALLDDYGERRQTILQEHSAQVDAAVDWVTAGSQSSGAAAIGPPMRVVRLKGLFDSAA